eukprot:gnl/MRDRNA2_/MRDRNA2_55806_c0_seq2.p1 gnl/MRDRNA2_/MRDRNA2_55806_c0~~gnl/MRDRNA2_/MRDRNA2_55806_c0_seq2.p1  ORF type:complete len:736 (+),score=102.99 gnl/MRDRNA2_/MRDRNA2_55806_c0_seq2:122-2209(+)
MPADVVPGAPVTIIYELTSKGIAQRPSESPEGPVALCMPPVEHDASAQISIDHIISSQCCSNCGMIFLLLIVSIGVCVLAFLVVDILGLLLIALVPALVFMHYCWYKCKSSLQYLQMWTSFGEAIAWCIPLLIIILIFHGVWFDSWLEPTCTNDVEDGTDTVVGQCVGKDALMHYFRAAFLEEVLKYLCVRRIVWHPVVVDAHALMVYGACAGLGFAAFENIEYVLTGGIGVGIARAFISIPGHMMYAGMHASLLGRRRFLKSSEWRFFTVLPLPVVLHGTHNFSLTLTSRVHPACILFTLANFVACVLIVRYLALQLSKVPRVDINEMIKAGLVNPPCCCCSLASEKDALDLSHPLVGVSGGLVVPLGGTNPVARGVEQGNVEVSLTRVFERAHIGCPDLVQTSGKWYYEVVLAPGVEQPRVGWVGHGVPVGPGSIGDCAYSWAVGCDGLWHTGFAIPPEAGGVGGSWPVGATIGCSIDFDARTMEYTINGSRWGPACEGFELPGTGLLPAVSFSGVVLLRFANFEYPLPDGCRALAEGWQPPASSLPWGNVAPRSPGATVAPPIATPQSVVQSTPQPQNAFPQNSVLVQMNTTHQEPVVPMIGAGQQQPFPTQAPPTTQISPQPGVSNAFPTVPSQVCITIPDGSPGTTLWVSLPGSTERIQVTVPAEAVVGHMMMFQVPSPMPSTVGQPTGF